MFRLSLRKRLYNDSARNLKRGLIAKYSLPQEAGYAQNQEADDRVHASELIFIQAAEMNGKSPLDVSIAEAGIYRDAAREFNSQRAKR